LVGTWGAVFFPLAWQGFREWWAWKKSQVPREKYGELLYIDDLITDKYFRDNPEIWSPWMIRLASYICFMKQMSLLFAAVVRFAFETGAKSLYPNLPGSLSLATNRRDKGENYETSLGPRTLTLRRSHLTDLCSGEVSWDGATGRLWEFPSTQELARWQFDLGLRRAGVGKGHADSLHVDVADDGHEGDSATYSSLSEKHTEALGSMLEAYLDPSEPILHLAPSPAVLTRMTRTGFTQHLALATNCREAEEGGAGCIRIGVQDVLAAVAQSEVWRSARLAIVNVSAVSNWGVDMLQVLWRGGMGATLEYVLVLGPCTGAPSDIHIAAPARTESCEMNTQGEGFLCDANGSSFFRFTIVEDVCVEKGADVGGTLYRRASRLSHTWMQERFGVVRRMAGNMVMRRIVQQQEVK
jgi:hypothetical protein